MLWAAVSQIVPLPELLAQLQGVPPEVGPSPRWFESAIPSLECDGRGEGPDRSATPEG
jgi:hypothetical protein